MSVPLSNEEKVARDIQGIQISEQNFNKVISYFLEFFKKCGIAEGDKRHYELAMLFMTLIYAKFQREAFIDEVNNKNKKIEKYLQGLGTKNVNAFLDQFDIYNRATFASLLNFQFEMIFKGLLEELNIKPESDDYYFIVKSLVSEIYSDEEVKTKKRRTLMTMAQIRNSLHSGGIHASKYEFDIDIWGTKFKFETGKKIDQASWGHLIIIANAMFDILSEILMSQKIKDLQFINKK